MRYNPRVRGLAVTVSLLLLAACSAPEVVLAPVDGARSLVLVTARDGVPISARAIEAAAKAQYYAVPLEQEDGDELYLFGYRCDLAALGLKPGVLELSEDGAELAATGFALTARIEAGAAAPWTEAGAAPDLLSKTRVAATVPGRCTPWISRTFELPTRTRTAAPTFAVSLGSGRVLIATTPDRQFFLIDQDGFSEVANTLDPPLGSRAGFLDGTAGLWTVDDTGRTRRHDAELTRGERTGSIGAGNLEFYAWLDGAADELFLLTDLGALHHRTATSSTWRALAAPEEARSIGPIGSLAWIAPGEALLIREPVLEGQPTRRTVEHVTPEGLRTAEVPIDDRLDTASDWPASVALIPGLGAVTGTRRGRFFAAPLEEGLGRFEALPPSPSGRSARSIVPHRAGFVATAGGGIVEYSGDSFCTPNYFLAEEDDLRFLVRAGDRLVAVNSNEAATQQLRVVYLEARRDEGCGF